MSRVSNTEEECNAIPPASKSNAAFAESAPQGISTGGGDQTRTPIYFSWELAIKINPKQPDVAASVAIYGLYTWQCDALDEKKLNHFGYTPYINGKRACYRSTRELESDYSLPDGSKLYTDTALLKALNRAEKALDGGFVIYRKFGKAIRGKLHYHLSSELISQYKFCKRKRNGLRKFYLEDAVKYGELGAVLLANLDFQILEFPDPVGDDAGRKYGELSGAKLTKDRKDKDGANLGRVIPKHRDTVNDAISGLVTSGAIIQHPTRKGFYRRLTNAEEVSSHVEEVSSGAEEVSRRVVETIRNMPNSNDLQEISKTPDSNTDSKPDRKCIPTETFTLRSDVSVTPSEISSGAKKLMSILADEAISYVTEGKGHLLAAKNSLQDYAAYRVVDHDQVEFIGYELPYDFVAVDDNTAKPYSPVAEIDYSIRQFITDYKYSSWFSHGKKEITSLRQLFLDNPQFTYEHLQQLITWCEPRVEPMYLGNWAPPKKGWDFRYWSRRVTNLKAFLRYLPQIIREYYINELSPGDDYIHPQEGMPQFDYSEMPEPFLTLAFKETNEPVCRVRIDIAEEGEWLDTNEALRKRWKNPDEVPLNLQWRVITPATDAVREVFYPEFKYGKDLYNATPRLYESFDKQEYESYMAKAWNDPNKEIVEHEQNPMALKAA